MGCRCGSGTLDGVRAKYDVVDTIGRGIGPPDDDDVIDWAASAGCSRDTVDGAQADEDVVNVIGRGVEPLNGDKIDWVARAARGCGTGT